MGSDHITIRLPIPPDDIRTLVALFSMAVLILLVVWLVSNWPFKEQYDRLPKLQKRFGANVIAYLSILFVPIWIALVLFTLDGIFELWWLSAPQGEANALANRVHYLAFVGLMGALAALLATPLGLYRIFTTERQTTATEEGLITDRINKAVEGLGAVRTVKRQRRSSQGTLLFDNKGGSQKGEIDPKKPIFEEVSEPNLEVRIGAIYALERIAQDSLRDHIQIMEILCAYIRQNAPASAAPELPPPPDWDDCLERGEWREEIRLWINDHNDFVDENSIKPRTDIAVALTVIGRRSFEQKRVEWDDWQPFEEFEGRIFLRLLRPNDSEKDGQSDSVYSRLNALREAFMRWDKIEPRYRLDLRNSNLCGADLGGKVSSSDFSLAQFDGAKAEGANFRYAGLQCASFLGARLQNATFSEANIQATVFREAQIQGGRFGSAEAHGADFSNANLQGARFLAMNAWGTYFDYSHAQGADFRTSNFCGTVFSNSRLEQAFLAFSNLNGCEFVDTLFDDGSSISESRLRCALFRSDLSDLDLSQEQLDTAFADESTVLPPRLERPLHWPGNEFGYFESLKIWEAWLKSSKFDWPSLIKRED